MQATLIVAVVVGVVVIIVVVIVVERKVVGVLLLQLLMQLKLLLWNVVGRAAVRVDVRMFVSDDDAAPSARVVFCNNKQ